MARTRARRVLLKFCFAAGVVCLVLHVLCLPFYAGRTWRNRGGWRLEHGRMTVWRSGVAGDEPFYVAPNSEGLRWGFEGHLESPREWRATVPLWIAWGGAFAAGVLAWRGRAEGPTRKP